MKLAAFHDYSYQASRRPFVESRASVACVASGRPSAADRLAPEKPAARAAGQVEAIQNYYYYYYLLKNTTY